MKKILSAFLVLVMIFCFVACGNSNGAKTSAVLPAENLNTLNAIFKKGFAWAGTSITENVYVQTVANSKNEEFLVVVKIADDQMDEFSAIDYFDEDALEKYLAVIGDSEILDVYAKADIEKDEFEFQEEYVAQFLDEPEKAEPKDLGDAKASVEEINKEVGSNIKTVAGATEEKFSVIDGKIAQYIYKIDDTYYCVRSSADTSINLAHDEFDEDPIVDEDGYITISTSQNDFTNSVRFVFNNYQYAYIVYDNGVLDWSQFDVLSGGYRKQICEYKSGSVFEKLLGTYSSSDNYSMSIIPVSDTAVQVTIFTYNETEQKLWTMLAKESGSKLSYDKSTLETYKNGDMEKTAGGKGSLTVNGGLVVWDKHTFTLVQ